MKRLTAIFVTIILAVCSVAVAQVPDYETFRRQQEEGFRHFTAERDSILQQMQNEFDAYVEQRNREYAEYLKNEWERMQAFMEQKPDPGPKPDEIPPFDPDKESLEQQQQRSKREEVVIRTIPPTDARVQPREQFHEPVTVRPPDPQIQRVATVQFDFYGRQFTIDADRSFRGIRATGNKEEDIASWFEKATQANYTSTLVNLLDIAEETGMNDWALFMAAQNLGNRLANNHELTARIYTWFILLQAGYDIRLGRQQNQLVFLLPFSHVVYNTPRLEIDDKTFYLIGGQGGLPVFTYKQTMPGAFRLFDMNFYKSPQFALQGQAKTLKFEHNATDYSIALEYDPILVAMLADQPQADMNVYLDADGSNFLVQSAEQMLEPILEPMTDVQKVAFLLQLAQSAFEYKTDIDQFDMQKYMVPDEVIHYDYSDCDDRAVLFGWLVRNYTGQKVAALLYPGHLANAVHFHKGNPPGDYVMVDGLEFVVADPTYVHAPIGLTMPDFIHVAPTAWVIDSGRYLFEQSLAVWQKLAGWGARRGNNQRDMIVGNDGNIYVTGYFTGSFASPDNTINLNRHSEQRYAFVAALNKDIQPLWAHAFESSQDATGFSVLTNEAGNIVVAGSFAENVTLGNQRIVSSDGQRDVFVAGMRPSGQLLWMKNAGLNGQHGDNAIAYALHIDQDGNLGELHFYNDPRESSNGLFPDGAHGLVLTGTFGNTSGLRVESAPELASRSTMDYADLLINKNQELRQSGIESSIAGLFAAIQLSKSEGVVFPGSAAQQALRKANPSFSRNFPTTFENIGKISFLRNKSGIIEIRTENGQDVFFDKMRIRNGSTVRVRSLANGDEQIDILSDIHVGQAIVWYPLNFVRLHHRSGDLLFDYRRNNSQVTLNLKKDILN